MAKANVADVSAGKAGKKIAAPAAKTTREFKIGSKTIVVSNEDLICGGILLILVFMVHSIRSNFLGIPFERDEGIYSYFGTLVLEGKTPYKDFYEVKFPGLFYFFAIIVKLFGDTVEGMHTGFMWVNIISMVCLYFASRNLFSPVAGVITAMTFAFVSMTPNLSGFTVQSEQGVSFFISIGLLFYSLARLKRKLLFYCLMGLAMGCAFMVKTTGLFLALWGGVVIIADFWFSKPREWKQFFKNMAAYAVGGFSIIGLMFGIIIMKGSFNEMMYWTVEHARQYANSMPYEEGVKYFKYTRDAILQNYKFFWYHSILAVGLCLLRPINIKYKILGVTLLAFSFFTIVPGYFFYGHYWIQTVPGLALVAGLTFYSVIQILNNTLNFKQPVIKWVYLGVFALLTFNHVSELKSYYYHPNYERILRSVYGNNPFPEAWEVGQYINTHSKPEDNIVLIGSEPEIYFYTHKKSPSRHAYFTAIVNNVKDHKLWQQEFERDTEKANPKFVVFFNHQLSLLVQPKADTGVFDWANKFITEKYQIVGLVDMIDGQQSVYKYDQDIYTYKPVSQNQIYIYQRKDTIAPAKPA
jgi:hypothetical protein